MFFSDSDISGLHKHLYLFFMQKILLLVSHGETEITWDIKKTHDV